MRWRAFEDGRLAPVAASTFLDQFRQPDIGAAELQAHRISGARLADIGLLREARLAADQHKFPVGAEQDTDAVDRIEGRGIQQRVAVGPELRMVLGWLGLQQEPGAGRACSGQNQQQKADKKPPHPAPQIRPFSETPQPDDQFKAVTRQPGPAPGKPTCNAGGMF